MLARKNRTQPTIGNDQVNTNVVPLFGKIAIQLDDNYGDGVRTGTGDRPLALAA